MIQISERAANYAAENANKVVNDALAQAYADGFRDGYKTREEEIPVDLRDNKTEYVDLGLPSGTLWAKDYERDGENVKYVTYGIAEKMCIPTEDQWKELIYNCRRVPIHDYTKKINPLVSVSFVGRNGNCVIFPCCGIIEAENNTPNANYTWIKNEGGQRENAVDITKDKLKTFNVFEGYKLPVRLIRNKE